MSAEDVEVVRAVNEPWDGLDVAAALHEQLAAIDLEDRPAVLASMRALLANSPSWRHIHPEVVWDAGPMFGVARGLDEFALFWPEWAGMWESYVPRMLEYRDLGGWIYVPAEVVARGRGGIPVDMKIFQLFRVRDGKVAMMRAFLSEKAALAAAAT
ncbi:MAG TPA: hypothetical protein VH817_09435 [Thermoleophilaceae bacterium]